MAPYVHGDLHMMKTLVSRALRVLGAGMLAFGMTAAMAHDVVEPAPAAAATGGDSQAGIEAGSEYDIQNDLDAPIDNHLLPELEVGSI